MYKSDLRKDCYLQIVHQKYQGRNRNAAKLYVVFIAKWQNH